MIKNLCAVILFLSGVAHAASPSFAIVHSLKLGQTNMSQASSVIGQPNGTDLIQAAGLTEWYYFDSIEESPRLVLRFDDKTKILANVSWTVREKDLERNIEKAKAAFGKSHFEKVTRTKDLADVLDSFSYLYDPRLGVSLTLSYDGMEVESIQWELPAASRAQWLVDATEPAVTPIPRVYFEGSRRHIADDQ